MGNGRREPRLVWVFSGQGTHWVGMAEALRRRWPVVEETLAEIAAHADEGDGVGGFFDAHGDRLAPEAVGEIDHGPAERRVGPVDAAIDNVGAREL